MKPDLVCDLLTRCDAAAPPPLPASGDLAANVRRRAKARMTGRRIGAVLTICSLVGFAIAHALHSGLARPSAVVNSVDVAKVKLELAALDSQASAWTKSARAIEMAKVSNRLSLVNERLAAEPPDARLQMQRELAGAILIRNAKWMAMQPEHLEQADAALRQVARLFAETSAGGEARRRLATGF